MGLDIASLGHSSPTAAATALLWEVLGSVDTSEELENPLLLVESALSLEPRARCAATWPSLYKALRDAVLADGCLLLPRVGQVLRRECSADFETCSLSFLTKDGQLVKLKRMEHVVEAVLRWRDERVELHRVSAAQCSKADEVFFPRLELAVPERGSDFVLRAAASKRARLPRLNSLKLASSPRERGGDAAKGQESSDDTASTGLGLSSSHSSRHNSRPASPGASTPNVAAISSGIAGVAALGDRRSIPSGIVERRRSHIELSA